MLTVNYAKNTDELSEILIKDIEKDKEYSNPLYKPKIIIPNSNLQKYLELYITEKQGIFFVPEFYFLEGALFNILERSSLVNNYGYYFLNSKRNSAYLNLSIYYLINDALINSKGEIDRILKYTGEEKTAERQKKIWQLSEKLSVLFREYEYKRPEMIESWLNDKKEIGTEEENFQKFIYGSLYGKDTGLFNNIINGKRIVNLNTLMKNFLTPDPCEKKTSDSIRIFGLSNISRFHYNIIKQLSSYIDFKLYLVAIHVNNNDYISPLGFKDKNLLQIKEIFTDKAVTNYPESNNLNNTTLLNSLKEYLYNQTIIEPVETDYNQSLIITGAVGIEREVSTVYNSIIYNIYNNSNTNKYNPEDIAVLVTDMGKYYNTIKYVFDKNEILPYNVTDSNAGNDSLYGKSVKSILKLSKNGITRKDIFDFLYNQLFLNKFGLTTKDIDVFYTLCSDLKIFHNKNPESIFSWNKGLKRLRLSKIMDTPNISRTGEFDDYYGFIPYIFTVDQKNELFLLTGIVDDLIKDVNSLKNIDYSKPFGDKLVELFNKYIEISENEKSEEFVRTILFERISVLDDMYQLKGDFRADFDLLGEFFDTILNGIPSGRGSYLSKGITISSLMPMRPVPFKIIYILGLGADEFPGRDNPSGLNLIKDYSKELNKTELNNFIFQETIFSACDKLILSYNARDPEKDEELYPSSCINAVIDIVNNKIFNRKNRIEVIKTPINFLSSVYLKDNNSELLKNYNLDELELLKIKAGINEDEQVQYNLNKISDSSNQISQDIKLSEIVKFIKNPIEQSLRRFAGIFNDNERFEDDENEPFYTDALYESILYKTIITEALNNDIDLIKYSDGFLKYDTLKGFVADGPFADAERHKLINNINHRIESNKLSETITDLKNNNTIFNYKGQSNGLPAIDFSLIDNIGQSINFTGKIDLLIKDTDDNYKVLIVIRNENFNINNLIEPYLYYISLITSGLYRVNSFSVIVSMKDGVKNVLFNNISKEDCVDYLNQILDLYLKKDFLFVPIDILKKKYIFNIIKSDEENDKINEILKGELFELIDNPDSDFIMSDILRVIENIKDYIPDNPLNYYQKIIMPIADIFYSCENGANDG